MESYLVGSELVGYFTSLTRMNPVGSQGRIEIVASGFQVQNIWH